MGLIPTVAVEPKDQNPNRIAIFGKPKAGKTTSLAGLEDNLIIEMDPKGASFVKCLYVDVNEEAKKQNKPRYEILFQIIKELRDSKKRFKHLTLDTITELEEIVVPYAKILYQQTPMGKNYGQEPGEDDVRKLPNGSGL